jgi:hypothetical protein
VLLGHNNTLTGSRAFAGESLVHEPSDGLHRIDRRALRGTRCPGSSRRFDQKLTVGQTPAKPGSLRRLAALLESNNTLNVPYRLGIDRALSDRPLVTDFKGNVVDRPGMFCRVLMMTGTSGGSFTPDSTTPATEQGF